MGMEAVTVVKKARGAKVLCIGDVMLDRYVYGNANRISPEAPVPVVHVKRQVSIPGGVGNVVKNLEAFGILPLMATVVGDDANADVLSRYFSGDGCATVTLLRDKDRPTIVKTRIVAGIQQVVRFDEEVLSPLSESVSARLLEQVDAYINEAGAVAISDYAKGVMTPELTQAVIGMAAARNCPIVVDPKGHDYGKYSGADLVKPNRKELGEAVGGQSVGSEQEVVEAGRSLMHKYGIKNLLVTLSEKGMLLLRECDSGREPVLLPSKAREVFDVTGAGDTVLAAMASSMAVGAPLELGARFATLAAGVVVGKVGTAVASVEEVEEAAREVMC